MIKMILIKNIIFNYMAHEIESEFVADWENEASQCQNCTSFQNNNNQNFCTESKTPIPTDGHCNFFQATD